MKRSFRSTKPARKSAGYPTFREGRRAFLQQLGAAVAGGALASMLGGCGDRAVGDDEPPEVTGGLPDRTPAPLDAGPETSGGTPDTYQAPLDMYPPPTSEGAALPPDIGEPPMADQGIAPMPDTGMLLDGSDGDA